MFSIYNWIRGATNWLIGAAAVLFWEFVGERLFCWLMAWFCGLLYLIFSYFIPAMIAFLELFPSMPKLVVGPVVSGWKIMNYFFPLTETLGVVTPCIVLIGLFRGFRFVKQFFPGGSN